MGTSRQQWSVEYDDITTSAHRSAGGTAFLAFQVGPCGMQEFCLAGDPAVISAVLNAALDALSGLEAATETGDGAGAPSGAATT